MLITLSETLIIPEITKTGSNNYIIVLQYDLRPLQNCGKKKELPTKTQNWQFGNNSVKKEKTYFKQTLM